MRKEDSLEAKAEVGDGVMDWSRSLEMAGRDTASEGGGFGVGFLGT